MKYKYSDISLSAEGDLAISPTGDLYVMRGIGSLRQGIESRLKTDLGDLFTHPKFGNKLKDLVCKRNTKQTAEQGRQSIISCLTYDGFIDPGDLSVVAIPVSITDILYHIEVSNGSYVVYKFDLVCDLENGIRRV